VHIVRVDLDCPLCVLDCSLVIVAAGMSGCAVRVVQCVCWIQCYSGCIGGHCSSVLFRGHKLIALESQLLRLRLVCCTSSRAIRGCPSCGLYGPRNRFDGLTKNSTDMPLILGENVHTSGVATISLRYTSKRDCKFAGLMLNSSLCASSEGLTPKASPMHCTVGTHISILKSVDWVVEAPVLDEPRSP